MTNTAMLWLVYEMTASAMWLGIFALVSQLPTVLCGPFAGVWVDRVDRMKLLLAAQAFSMAKSVLLTLLTFAGWLDLWMLLALAGFQGAVSSVDFATKQSLMPALAEEKERLPGVIGLNASVFHLARLIGPALGGMLIASKGAAFCFALDSISYLVVIAAFFGMRLNSKVDRKGNSVSGVRKELLEGILHVWHSPAIRGNILVAGSMSFFGLSYASLMPAFSQEFLGGDSKTFGILISSAAFGSLLAGLFLAGRGRIAGLSKVIVVGAMMAGFALLAFAFSRNLLLSCGFLALSGAGGILVMASNNTLLQSIVEDSKRGRVMSLYLVVFLGAFPLGAVFSSSLATIFGLSASVAFSGICTLVLAFLYWKKADSEAGTPRVSSKKLPGGDALD